MSPPQRKWKAGTAPKALNARAADDAGEGAAAAAAVVAVSRARSSKPRRRSWLSMPSHTRITMRAQPRKTDLANRSPARKAHLVKASIAKAGVDAGAAAVVAVAIGNATAASLRFVPAKTVLNQNCNTRSRTWIVHRPTRAVSPTRLRSKS